MRQLGLALLVWSCVAVRMRSIGMDSGEEYRRSIVDSFQFPCEDLDYAMPEDVRLDIAILCNRDDLIEFGSPESIWELVTTRSPFAGVLLKLALDINYEPMLSKLQLRPFTLFGPGKAELYRTQLGIDCVSKTSRLKSTPVITAILCDDEPLTISRLIEENEEDGILHLSDRDAFRRTALDIAFLVDDRDLRDRLLTVGAGGNSNLRVMGIGLRERLANAEASRSDSEFDSDNEYALDFNN